MINRQDLWAQLVIAAGGPKGGTADPNGLCTACVDIVGVAGAAITLMTYEAAVAASFASDPSARRLQELQFTLGDGPTVEAYRSGEAVSFWDLTRPGSGRWPGFPHEAVEAGVCGVYALPLRVGAARLGVLTLYRSQRGPLAEATYGCAIVVAELVTRMILSWQASAPEGQLAGELADDGVYQAGVHQASGRISAQLGIGVMEALSLLRAHAFPAGRPIGEVAAEVNAGLVRLGR
ncbi:MAG: ANTAR domain-containing protein [Acidimicrobiales bacterium]